MSDARVDLDDVETVDIAARGEAAAAGEPATVAVRPALPQRRPVPSQPPPSQAAPSAPNSGSDARQDPAALLRAAEKRRAVGWAAVSMILAAGQASFTPWLPGTARAKGLFYASLAVLVALGAWVIWRCRQADGYTTRVFRVFAFGTAACSVEIIHYLGPFSPTPLVVTLGISFFGFGIDRFAAVVASATAVVAYLVLAILALAGVLADDGAFPVAVGSTSMRVSFTVMVPIVLLTSLWMARLAQRTLVDAIERAQEEARVANVRAEQLVEAQRDLDKLEVPGVLGRLSRTAAGDWQLAEVIGRGAMGEVYAARHAGDGRVAAVKVLREIGPDESRLRERFEREGALVPTLRSPHIVAIYDTGVVAGMPFIAMERLEGEDLARRLRRTSRLGRDEAIQLVRDVARGLDVAHAAGVVHRDLKPHNLYWSRVDGVWKILDFGVASLIGSTGTLTQAAVVGTPGYMAPEQARGKPVDARSDVFALGAVIYRALTGRAAFTGVDTPQLLFAVVYHHPAAPSVMAPGLPRAVDVVLSIALAKAPADRFAHASELAEALAAALHGTAAPPLVERAAALMARHPWGRAVTET